MSVTIPRRDRRSPLVSLAALTVITVLSLAVRGPAWSAGHQPQVLRLATTTSTADTGLLPTILPEFERRCACRVDVIAVGTGQALELGRRGDVDVLLVHARDAEFRFVAEGHGVRRDDVMYNDFVVVGPASDPAGIVRTRRASLALAAIAAARVPFASRGDRSGTHTKEQELWKSAGLSPARTASWYLVVGQGMGETLTFANERQAYALTDRATWLSMRDRLGRLRLLFGGGTLADNPDADLRNDYGVIAVNPKTHAGVRAGLANQFVEWLLSESSQERIGAFGVKRFGQPLFYPNSDELKASREVRVEIGSKTRTFSVDSLRALPRVTLANHEVIGVKRGSVLAYQRDGRRMTGRDGLIQLVVGADQFASRYSHWVSAVRVH